MPNYQRIAVLVLRLGGVIWSSVIAVMWLAYVVERAVGIDVLRYPTHTIIGNVAYMVLGFVLAWMAKPLVRRLGRDLEG